MVEWLEKIPEANVLLRTQRQRRKGNFHPGGIRLQRVERREPDLPTVYRNPRQLQLRRAHLRRRRRIDIHRPLVGREPHLAVLADAPRRLAPAIQLRAVSVVRHVIRRHRQVQSSVRRRRVQFLQRNRRDRVGAAQPQLVAPVQQQLIDAVAAQALRCCEPCQLPRLVADQPMVPRPQPDGPRPVLQDRPDFLSRQPVRRRVLHEVSVPPAAESLVGPNPDRACAVLDQRPRTEVHQPVLHAQVAHSLARNPRYALVRCNPHGAIPALQERPYEVVRQPSRR